jgi:hypothetical protein
MNARRLLTPDIASLVAPLFAFGGKRGMKNFSGFEFKQTLFTACGREGGPAKRRPGESTPTGKRSAYCGYNTFTPPSPAIIAFLAIPKNKECSTTPGTILTAFIFSKSIGSLK